MKELKERLLEIRQNNWIIPSDVNPYEFSLELLDHIGSIDSELRDELILEMLWVIITESKITKKQMKELLDICLSERHLFYQLGHKNDDSVFNRSFTVLVITAILSVHNNSDELILNHHELLEVYEKLIQYIKSENDLRGYVLNKGWAHAMAHVGDVLNVLASSKELTQNELKNILAVIREKISITEYVYINEEIERLVTVVTTILSRNLVSENEIKEWVTHFINRNKQVSLPEIHYYKENVKNFLRSLYFRLKYKEGPLSILNEIEEVLNHINERFNQR